MKKTGFLLLFLAALSQLCFSQQSPSKEVFAENITIESSRNIMKTLTSADFQGRGIDQKGGRLTAEFLSNEFKNAGLFCLPNTTYFQQVPLTKTSFTIGNFKINQLDFKNGQDLLIVGANPFKEYAADEIVFIGLGIDAPNYSNLKNIDIKNKIVLFLNIDEPRDAQGRSVITGNTSLSEWSAQKNKRIENLQRYHPKMILSVVPQLSSWLQKNSLDNQRPQFSTGNETAIDSTQIPTVFITDHLGNYLFNQAGRSRYTIENNLQKNLSPETFVIKTPVNSVFGITQKQVFSPNVYGILKATHPTDEYVMISANYDGDGTDETNAFQMHADDNASGTTALLEIARQLAQAQKQGATFNKNILFIAYGAEKPGHISSSYFLQHPIVPLKDIKSNIFISNIGKSDHAHPVHNYIYLEDHHESAAFMDILKANNTLSPMEIDRTSNMDNTSPRIAEKSIPFIHFFGNKPVSLQNQLTEAEDSLEKIEYSKMIQRERLLFQSIWDLITTKN